MPPSSRARARRDSTSTRPTTRGQYRVPPKNANTMRKGTRVAYRHVVTYEYAHRPELFQYMKNVNVEQTEDSSWKSSSVSETSKSSSTVQPAAFWKSTYKHNVNDALSRPMHRANRPEWSLPRQAYTSQRTFFVTENMKSFGTYGSKPIRSIRKRSTRTHVSISFCTNSASVGTTKTTKHIPGYSGFLPKTDLNPQAVAQGQGAKLRETIIKQNIVENYNVKIPGYSGHKPMSALNDRGAIRPSCLTNTGEAFY